MNEQLVNLLLWMRDGYLISHLGNGKRLPEVSIGRTESRRGLGFSVTNGKTVTEFVLNREQVKSLRVYLDLSIPRLRKSGGEKSMLAAMKKTRRAAAIAAWPAQCSARRDSVER